MSLARHSACTALSNKVAVLILERKLEFFAVVALEDCAGRSSKCLPLRGFGKECQAAADNLVQCMDKHQLTEAS